MRKLHPIGARERLILETRFFRPDRSVEEGLVHALGAGRYAVRASVEGDRRIGLWHLVIDEHGTPERLQARIVDVGATVDVTFTFFSDEVLVWRRGGGVASEAVALPPGYGLLWPPYTGRGLALAGLPAVEGRDARTFALVRACPPAEGALEIRPEEIEIRPAPGGLSLFAPGYAEARVELAPDGEVARWRSEGEIVERSPVSPGGGGGGMIDPSTNRPAAQGGAADEDAASGGTA